MQDDNNNTKKDFVSPNTTLPWPYSHHSNLNYMENGGTIQDNKKDSDVPDEILVASNDGLDDEEESLDLVGIAHQIKERDQNLARQLKDSD
jgi:hypothetical protein